MLVKNVSLLVALPLLLAVGVAEAKGIACKAFSNQSQAQDYMDARKAGWKRLDRDGDGEACECLPGGSREGEARCEKWREKNGK